MGSVLNVLPQKLFAALDGAAMSTGHSVAHFGASRSRGAPGLWAAGVSTAHRATREPATHRGDSYSRPKPSERMIERNESRRPTDDFQRSTCMRIVTYIHKEEGIRHGIWIAPMSRQDPHQGNVLTTSAARARPRVGEQRSGEQGVLRAKRVECARRPRRWRAP
ncbi:hypothetical protein BC834DRAFT_879689 [Gloeopeniophorella convolvens]|nr:hypothetical protein BC834DRAFT_879689 [Gloeopeniophorella convolvens]